MPTIIKIKRKGGDRWKAIVRRRELGGAALTKSFRLYEDAEGWGRRKEDQLARGTWRDERSDPARTTTLRQALARYARDVTAGKRGKSQEQSTVRILRDDALARKTLAIITSADIASLRDRWKHDAVAPGTIHRRMHTLSHLFTVARQEWSMPGLDNPCHGVRLDKEPAGRDRRVSDAELAAIKVAAGDAELPAFIDLAVETACRRGELARLTWSDIDMRGKTARIRETKNDTPRTVPLTPRALAVLRGMPRRLDGRLFAPRRARRRADEEDKPRKSDPAAIFSVHFERAVVRARKDYEAGCKDRGEEPDARFCVDVRLHDLRHEATSRLAKLLPVHALARVTGHKTLGMLMRYYNPTATELADQLQVALVSMEAR
jgi:integrase